LIVARVTQLAIRVDPNVLPAATGATLGVGVDITTEGGGDATNGTKVQINIEASDPLGIAAIEDGPIIVGSRETVNLLVAAAAKSIKLTATYDDRAGARVEACRIVTGLGGASTAGACN
jgi:hypothetical protein